jgi:hypothetical protein
VQYDRMNPLDETADCFDASADDVARNSQESQHEVGMVSVCWL